MLQNYADNNDLIIQKWNNRKLNLLQLDLEKQ